MHPAGAEGWDVIVCSLTGMWSSRLTMPMSWARQTTTTKTPWKPLKELKVKPMSFRFITHAQHDSLNMMPCTDAASINANTGDCSCALFALEV